MEFPDTFIRLRPGRLRDEMNPRRTVRSWDAGTEEITLAGFLDSEDPGEQPSASRSELVTTAVLYLADTQADVRRGDRITDGERTWDVQGFPAAPRNPFTGWRPYKVVNLQEVRG